MIITRDDEAEIAKLKEEVKREFEVKELNGLKYFLGMEVARSRKGLLLAKGSIFSTF